MWAVLAIVQTVAVAVHPEAVERHLDSGFGSSAREEGVSPRSAVERSAFFENARMAISDRGAQAATLAKSVVDMLDEDKRRMVVEEMRTKEREQMRNLEVAAAQEERQAEKARSAHPDSFVLSPTVLAIDAKKPPPAKPKQEAVKPPQAHDAYTVHMKDYVTLLSVFGLLVLLFTARLMNGLSDPIAMSKELLLYTFVFMPVCAGYLWTAVGSACVWSLLQCCIADMLMGFDNLLDLSGWYSNTNIPMHKVTTLLIVGGFLQLNLRFALSFGVHFLTGQVDSLSRVAGALVVLCGLRTMWFSSTIEKESAPQPDESSPVARSKTLKGMKPKAASMMDMLGRAVLVEFTDALGSLDSLCGKLVNTQDLLVINASSFVGVFFVRGLAIVLLLNMAKKQSNEYDRFTLPTEIFLPFVGMLLLLIGFHGLFPGDVPAIPAFANIAIACAIYGYLTFRLFSLSRRERRPSLTE